MPSVSLTSSKERTIPRFRAELFEIQVSTFDCISGQFQIRFGVCGVKTLLAATNVHGWSFWKVKVAVLYNICLLDISLRRAFSIVMPISLP